MCKLGLSSGPPGGRPRARLKAGTPRHPHQRRATVPQQLPDAVRGPKQRGEHQPSNLCVEGRAEPPTEPRIDTEIRRPTGMSWSQLNAGATIPHEHTTGCNSMQNRPASKTPVGLHLAAQVRHVHSVKKRSPAQQQQLVPPATRHARLAKPATLSPVCKQWGCPAVVRCVCTKRLVVVRGD